MDLNLILRREKFSYYYESLAVNKDFKILEPVLHKIVFFQVYDIVAAI